MITFSLFGPDDSKCAAAPVFTSTVTVTGEGAVTSEPFVIQVPGSYRWVASYSGDSLNAAVGPMGCGDPAETVSVTAPPPPIPDPGPNVPERKPNSPQPKPKPKPKPPKPKPTSPKPKPTSPKPKPKPTSPKPSKPPKPKPPKPKPEPPKPKPNLPKPKPKPPRVTG